VIDDGGLLVSVATLVIEMAKCDVVIIIWYGQNNGIIFSITV